MTPYPLPQAALSENGIRPEQIALLTGLIEGHIREGRYPGAQIALARHGKLLLERTFGHARTEPSRVEAGTQTLWLLYSNTKVVLATALWKLCEQGAFRFTDRVSDHMPAFAKHGKKEITILQVITHQGGFPSALMSPAGWQEVATQRGTVHPAMHAAVADFPLEWTPGSKIHYHGLSAHWVLASLIETLTGRDFREVVREDILVPLGLDQDIVIGVPPAMDARIADMHEPTAQGMRPLPDSNNDTWRRAGAPGGGGYGSARGMVALYQMMIAGGALNGVRVLSPRMLAYALRNHTGDRVDEFMGMPMHRGLGPHLRGTTPNVRGIGALAAPECYGHGGVGTSYCWADPSSGVSFAYVTNNRIPDPWHSERLDTVANLVHAAILPLA